MNRLYSIGVPMICLLAAVVSLMYSGSPLLEAGAFLCAVGGIVVLLVTVE
jgi:hypothetical protein